MPYIKKEQRRFWNGIIEEIEANFDNTDISAGDLNYFISRLIWRQLEQTKNYARANELIGALECIKQEFYRRQIAPYEDKKINENGDIL